MITMYISKNNIMIIKSRDYNILDPMSIYYKGIEAYEISMMTGNLRAKDATNAPIPR